MLVALTNDPLCALTMPLSDVVTASTPLPVTGDPPTSSPPGMVRETDVTLPELAPKFSVTHVPEIHVQRWYLLVLTS